MGREDDIRKALSDALTKLDGDREALDLAAEIPAIERAVDDLGRARIAAARAAGASWAEIANRLGVTRQAVHKRWSDAARDEGTRIEIRLGRRRGR